MAGMGHQESAITCGKCGNAVWQEPEDPALGPSLFGNVCIDCSKVFCDECIQLGGPAPCPACGRPTKPGLAEELAKIGIAWTGQAFTASLAGTPGSDSQPLEPDDQQPRTLFEAAEQGDQGEVEALLESGAPVNAKAANGFTALHSAAARFREDHSEVIGALVHAGADIDARDDKGNTPLHAAARQASPENVRALLEAGADVNAQAEDGVLPLHMALMAAVSPELPGPADVVRLLVDAGAQLDIADPLGNAPLHWAASQGNAEIATILVEAGANPRKKDQLGRTPSEVEPFAGLDKLDWDRILEARPRRGLFGRRK